MTLLTIKHKKRMVPNCVTETPSAVCHSTLTTAHQFKKSAQDKGQWPGFTHPILRHFTYLIPTLCVFLYATLFRLECKLLHCASLLHSVTAIFKMYLSIPIHCVYIFFWRKEWLCDLETCVIWWQSPEVSTQLTLSPLMSYIYGAPWKAINFNVVYIWTYVWQRWKLSLSVCCTMFQNWINAESFPVSQLCVNTLSATKVTLITDGV
jgi:hypothetical protein